MPTVNELLEGLKQREYALKIGIYHLEYINKLSRQGPYLALLERPGKVSQLVDLNSEYIVSLLEYYDCEKVPEKY